MKKKKKFAAAGQQFDNHEQEYDTVPIAQEITEEDLKAAVTDSTFELQTQLFKNNAFKKIVKDGALVAFGHQGGHITIIKNALREFNDELPSTHARFDEELERAVVKFRQDHTLDISPVIDAEFIKTLDVALLKKKEQTQGDQANQEQSQAKQTTKDKETTPLHDNVIQFIIPIPRAMDARESHIHIYQFIFKVSEDSAAQILEKQLAKHNGYAGIWKHGFTQFTEKDVARGYKTFRIHIDFYNTYAPQKIQTAQEYQDQIHPDWKEQMAWFKRLLTGADKERILYNDIYQRTASRYMELTGANEVPTFKTEKQQIIYDEVLYEEIKKARTVNPFHIADYQTRLRIQQLYDTFTPAQKISLEEVLNQQHLHGEGNAKNQTDYDASFESFLQRYKENYDYWEDVIESDPNGNPASGKYDNYDQYLHYVSLRLKRAKPLPKHSGTSDGQRYKRLLTLLQTEERSDATLVTLVRGLNPIEQGLFWENTVAQTQLVDALDAEELLRAIATHEVALEKKKQLLNRYSFLDIPYTYYREFVFHAVGGAAVLAQLDTRFNHETTIRYQKGTVTQFSAPIGTPGKYIDPLTDERKLIPPNAAMKAKEGAMRDTLIAWKAEHDEGFFDSFLKYTDKEVDYDLALEKANSSRGDFEEKAEDLEDQFIPHFEQQAIKVLHTVLDASEQFLYKEFNKLADSGVRDFMSDMTQLEPQFELLANVLTLFTSGDHYLKNAAGELQKFTSPGGRGMYGEKYHALRGQIIQFLRDRHPLLYDAFDGDLYDIAALYKRFKTDPAGFEKEMLERFEEALGKKQEKIFETRKNVGTSPQDVWKLAPIITFTINAMQLQGTGFEAMAYSRVKAYEGVPPLLYFGLVLLSLAGGVLGGAALIALVLASATDVGVQYNDYDVKNDAANAVVTDSDLMQLTDDPSLVWLALAVAGLALDVIPAIKVFKRLMSISKIKATLDLKMYNKAIDDLARTVPTLTPEKVKMLRAKILAKQQFDRRVREMYLSMKGMTNTFGFPVSRRLVARLGALIEDAVKNGIKFDEFYTNLKAEKEFGDFLKANGLTDVTAEQKKRLKSLYEGRLDMTEYNPSQQLLESEKLNKMSPPNSDVGKKGEMYYFHDELIDETVGLMTFKDGYLGFGIYPKDVGSDFRGTLIFHSLVKRYRKSGGTYKGIRGWWNPGSDNTKEFNKLLMQEIDLFNKLSPVERLDLLKGIAFKTWTGKRAIELGFFKVSIDDLSGGKPPYSKVHVTFYK